MREISVNTDLNDLNHGLMNAGFNPVTPQEGYRGRRFLGLASSAVDAAAVRRRVPTSTTSSRRQARQ
jgi:hypothetical protein